ncbi:hypothetical protein [[Mycoplasma] imitans]|uniref:hypothetical protein n=1 Tax=[Mycoplasma] imitans TaxID=29560 RepID=UPI000686DBC2|nr:hypothetical protein [[Mycoplasma] imitans]
MYANAQTIINNTLSPVDGDIPSVQDLQILNTSIESATNTNNLTTQKENADTLSIGFIKYALDNQHLSRTDADHNHPQPWNYGFVGYNVDIGDNTNNQQVNQSNLNFSFAKKQIWLNPTTVLSDSNSLTDVAWIYGFFGSDAKYKLTFDYYGPGTAYLYFPYKLVKQADSTKVALQYKLNDGTNTPVVFGSQDQVGGSTNQLTLNPTPAVDKINVAKLTITGLTYGTNTIEFSVPTNQDKVAPMIGNMYLTSSDTNVDKIYDSIFGNQPNSENANVIDVDLVTGYSLAADYSTYLAPYTRAIANVANSAVTRRFLLGYVGGNDVRGMNTTWNTGTNPQKAPTNTNDARNYIFYVNAPQAGQYSIQGIYYTGESRGLNFSVDGSTSEVLKISNLLSSRSWDGILRKFDTNATNSTDSNTQQSVNSSLRFSKTSLHLNKGLDRIIVTGDSNITNKNTPNLGNLTFTFVNPQPNENPTTAPSSSASAKTSQS